MVKILDKELGEGDYYKKKGRITNYEGLWANVTIEDSGDIIKIHQKNLSTVVPNIGRTVVILEKGKYQKEKAILKSFDKETNEGTLSIEQKSKKFKEKKFHYTKFSKYYKN